MKYNYQATNGDQIISGVIFAEDADDAVSTLTKRGLKIEILEEPINGMEIVPLNSVSTNGFTKLIDYVDELHNTNAIHIKRGFALQDTTPTFATIHLLEEAVEFQAEVCCNGTREAIIEEAADTLACYLHVLRLLEISVDDVEKKAIEKLETVFSLDPNDILTDTPGLTRRSR